MFFSKEIQQMVGGIILTLFLISLFTSGFITGAGVREIFRIGGRIVMAALGGTADPLPDYRTIDLECDGNRCTPQNER